MKLTLTSLALLTIFISWLFSEQPLCSLCLCGCFFEQFLTTETQRTQRLLREELRKRLSCKASSSLGQRNFPGRDGLEFREVRFLELLLFLVVNHLGRVAEAILSRVLHSGQMRTRGRCQEHPRLIDIAERGFDFVLLKDFTHRAPAINSIRDRSDCIFGLRHRVRKQHWR